MIKIFTVRNTTAENDELWWNFFRAVPLLSTDAALYTQFIIAKKKEREKKVAILQTNGLHFSPVFYRLLLLLLMLSSNKVELFIIYFFNVSHSIKSSLQCLKRAFNKPRKPDLRID